MKAKQLQEAYTGSVRESSEINSAVTRLEAYRCEVTKCDRVGENLQKTLRELSNIKYALDQAAIIAIADSKGIIQYVNEKLCQVSQYDRSELINQKYHVLSSGYHAQEFFQEMWQTISSGEVWKGEIKDRAKDGSNYWVDTTIVPFLNEQGEPLQYLTIQYEITERKLAEEALRESQNCYHTLLNLSPVGIFATDVAGKFLDVNDRWCEMTGMTPEEALGDGWVQTIHPDDRELVLTEWYQATQKNKPFKSAEYRLQRPDGTTTWVFAQAVANTDPGTGAIAVDRPKAIGYVGTIADITERRKAEDQLRYHAWHDALTGLPNRAKFLHTLENAILRAKQHPDTLFAVLFLDLDRFKVINDSLGHLVGDRLLSGVAHRLSTCVRSGDTLARLGGDEFIILLEKIGDAGDAIQVAERIQKELAKPFHLDGYEVFTSASIGIVFSGSSESNLSNSALIPVISHNQSAHVLRDADTAMYHAKERGGIGHYAIFNQVMYTDALALLQLENDLRRALENYQEFVLHYQPIVALETGKITGFEALVRWQHPTRGLVSPAEFIPLAEETGLIIPLGRWVLSQAALQLRVWQLVFPEIKPLTMSINLSPKQFSHPGLVAEIDQILHETGIDGSSLNLEITETAVMENFPDASAMLVELKNRNIHLSLDDFGTGYSSLSLLAKLPLNSLKIDHSFVSKMGKNGDNVEIVWTIVTLAHNLGMQVVAEGIETLHQWAQLKSLQCDRGQGHFFSQALDAQMAKTFLTN